jgi:hypothetical protein
MPLLGELVYQKGIEYFSSDPVRLQEQVAKLGPTALDYRREATFPVLAEMGFDVEIMRQQAIENAREMARWLCLVVGMLTEQQCSELLQEAEELGPA